MVLVEVLMLVWVLVVALVLFLCLVWSWCVMACAGIRWRAIKKLL